MNRFTKQLIFIILPLVLLGVFGVFGSGGVAQAATKYWIGSDGGSFADNANWSLSSGGGNDTTAPGASDIATFDGGDIDSCTIDSSISVAGMSMLSGYTGTITQASTYTITVGASNFSQADGAFVGGDSTIDINGIFTQSGGICTSTSGIMYISSTFTISGGTFNHNSGTVQLDGSASTVNTGSTIFNDVIVAKGSSSDLTITGTMDVDGDLTLSEVRDFKTGTMSVAGDVITTDSIAPLANTGMGTILFDGTGDQNFNASGGTGYTGANISINKASGTLTVTDTIYITGNWTWTAGTVDAGNSTIYFQQLGVNKFLYIDSGTMSFNDVTINWRDSPDIVITGTMDVNGDLSIVQLNVISGGTIAVAGDVVVTDGSVGTITGVAKNLLFDGTGDQSFNASGGVGYLGCGVTINKPSGTLTIEDEIHLYDGWTLTAGTVDAGDSTIAFDQTSTNKTLSITPGTMSFNNVTINWRNNYTAAITGTMDVNGDLVISSVGSITGGITLAGDLTITEDVISGTGTITLDGANDQTMTAAAADFPNGTFTINKASGTATLASDIVLNGSGQDLTITAGTLDMASYSLTIPDTLTVNGILTQGAGALSFDDLVVGSAGTFNNFSTGAITVGTGGVVNAGHIHLDGTTRTCGEADAIQIRSSVDATARTWSGAGVFTIFDVDVKDQNGTVTTYSSTNTGNSDWTYTGACPAVSQGDFSFSVWLRPTNSIASKAIAVKNTEYRLVVDASGLPVCQVYAANAWITAATGTTALSLNSWSYLTCSYDQTNIKININGVLNTTAQRPYVDILNSANALNLGHDEGGTYGDFQGYIDEFKFYKYARTASQIKADYTGVSTPQGASVRSVTVGESQDSSEGLVAYWKMDETLWNGTAGEVVDSSGNGNHGTAVADATTIATAKFGRAGTFDGTGDYLDIGTGPTVVKTVAFWAKPDTTTESIIDLNGAAFIGASSGTLSATGFDSPSIYVNGALSSTIIADTWQHIVIVTNTSLNASDLDVGRLEGTDDYGGELDDIKIYNVARTAEQIRRDYESGPPPVAHWKMDENTGQYAYDNSGNANNGTLGSASSPDSADPSWTSGKYGSALKFDGSNDYVDAGTDSGLPLASEDRTIEMWFKINTEPDVSKRIFGYGTWSSNNAFDITINSNYTLSIIGHTNNYTGTKVLSLGTWYHFSAVVNGANIKTYINGVIDINTTHTLNTISGGHIYIGQGAYKEASRYFNGLIDDVRIYNYARTPKQIMEDMNAGHPAVGSPVGSYVSYWPLNESAGTTAYDKSTNKNDLTLSTASWTTDGKFGSAFDGGDNKRIADGADDSDFDFTATDDFSLSAWVRYSSTNPAATEYILHKQAGFEGYALYMDTDGDLVFGIGDTSSASFPEDTAGNIARDFADGSWHHVVGVKTSNTRIDTYVDGVLIGSDTSLAANATLENAGILYLGDANATDGTDEFLGDIDDVKIYRFALSPADIKLEYNRGVSLKLGSVGGQPSYTTSSDAALMEYCVPGSSDYCAAPVGRWKMDEKAGLSAYDTSGNNNTGTLTGGPTWKSSAHCKSGSCLSFDGSNDYVRLSSQVIPLGAKTISAWVKTTQSSTSELLDNARHSSGYHGTSFDIIADSSGHFKFWSFKGTAGNFRFNLESTTAVNNGNWHHLVGSWDGTTNSNGVKIYLDGVLNNQMTAATTETTNAYENMTIGCQSGLYGILFNGLIDDVRIYNYARTPAQIAYDYNRGKPVAHWKLDDGWDTATTCDGTGKVVYDSANLGMSTSRHNGTLFLGASPATSTAWSEAKFGCGLDFDGTDDYVDVGDLAIDYNLRSISFWINPDSTTEKVMDLDGVYTIELASGVVDLTSTTTETIYVDGKQTTAITTGWHNVVITLPSASPIDPDNLDFARAGGVYLDGALDDISFYTYTLTAEQIKTLYNQSSAVRFGPESGLP